MFQLLCSIMSLYRAFRIVLLFLLYTSEVLLFAWIEVIWIGVNGWEGGKRKLLLMLLCFKLNCVPKRINKWKENHKQRTAIEHCVSCELQCKAYFDCIDFFLEIYCWNLERNKFFLCNNNWHVILYISKLKQVYRALRIQ